MNLVFLFSLLCGLVAVLQAGINRQIASHHGLTWAVVINNATIFGLGLILFFASQKWPDKMPAFLRPGSLSQFKAWYLIPGLCGLCLVTFIPFSLSQVGALGTFVAIVTGQVIGTLLWDSFVETIPLHPQRLLGALLALAGVFLCHWKK